MIPGSKAAIMATIVGCRRKSAILVVAIWPVIAILKIMVASIFTRATPLPLWTFVDVSHISTWDLQASGASYH